MDELSENELLFVDELPNKLFEEQNMAWPATTRPLSDCLSALNSQSLKLRSSVESLSADSLLGDTQTIRYLQTQARVIDLLAMITECGGKSGFQQYARDQFATQGLNTNTELSALQLSVSGLQSAIADLLALPIVTTADAAAFRTATTTYSGSIA